MRRELERERGGGPEEPRVEEPEEIVMHAVSNQGAVVRGVQGPVVGQPTLSGDLGGHEDAHEAMQVGPLEDADFGAAQVLPFKNGQFFGTFRVRVTTFPRRRQQHPRLGPAPGLRRPVPGLLRRGVVGLTKKRRGGGGIGDGTANREVLN